MNTKVLATIAAMLMVAVIAVPAISADSATTQAEVTGCGIPPVIEEKFELDDDGDEPYHSTPGTQVMPLPDANKEVCVYVVASDLNGASDINRMRVTVDDPNGVQVAYGDTDASNITELLYAEAIIKTQAAFNQGLITDARRLEINDKIYTNAWRMWEFCFELSNCDPSGDYNVTATANDAYGLWDMIDNTFEYLSIKELAIDFTTISYGTVVPAAKHIVYGDDNFGTSDAPTVRNRANDPFKLNISATDMVGAGYSGNKILATNLDACVYGVGGSQEQNLDYYPGVLFDPVIDPCAIEAIDFSLLQNVIPPDTYSGTITLEPVAP